MRLSFHTNLDEPKRDVWDLNCRVQDIAGLPIPRVGELIRFPFDGGKYFELQVCEVSYMFGGKDPHVSVELHIPSSYGSISILEWETRFKKHRYGREP